MFVASCSCPLCGNGCCQEEGRAWGDGEREGRVWGRGREKQAAATHTHTHKHTHAHTHTHAVPNSETGSCTEGSELAIAVGEGLAHVQGLGFGV